MDIERFWFGGVLAGEPEVTEQFKAGAEAHWHVPDGRRSPGRGTRAHRWRDVARREPLRELAPRGFYASTPFLITTVFPRFVNQTGAYFAFGLPIMTTVSRPRGLRAGIRLVTAWGNYEQR
jgi:hypothetical protein